MKELLSAMGLAQAVGVTVLASLVKGLAAIMCCLLVPDSDLGFSKTKSGLSRGTVCLYRV